MCVDSMSDTLIRNFVRKLQAAGMVTSELLCITLRLACKKQWSGAVYFVLKTTKEGKFTTDLDGINSALEVFLHNKDTALAIDLLNSVQKGSFGPDVRCDWSTFGLLLMTTSRQADSIAFQRVHDFIAQNLSALPPSTNDQIFINALQRSVLRQELSIAQNVFALYKMFHGIVETRAYALLLTAYLDTAISTTKNTTSYIIEDRKHTEQQLCQLVNYILQSNLDNDPLIGDLVLRYHCSQQDLSSAYHYLTQRWSSSSAEMIPVVPSTVALHAYSDLVCADENVAHATLLHQYCAKHDLQPFVEVNRYSLLR